MHVDFRIQRVMEKIIKRSVTLGSIGYFPAPGTLGTFVTLPCVYALSYMPLLLQAVAIIIFCWYAYRAIAISLPSFDSNDPSEIIIDECAGTLITFFGLSLSPLIMVSGFVLFRVFDIFKPFGIKWCERLPGAWGVLVDDCVAGCAAHLILRMLFV